MSFMDYFRSSSPKKTASVAKERLQIIVAHQRNTRAQRPDFIPQLEKEIIEVIRKYVAVDDEMVKIEVDKTGNYSVLEVNVTLPDQPAGS
ncbi:cell division topological specificity factor MinE [Pelagibaculum spongiae]|uniref:Cell division topological specificity factor n=1 Tax=Pelagibaculum spongiae TaxID=2080658 RepID=A0A2V1GSE5_9GAMM|nr:cell division topological specificity factor MinE [Pelagibaculum spongiae]PVZ64968.1 cell division topological specificity factor MinE [Pelagibaculum spongiae]